MDVDVAEDGSGTVEVVVGVDRDGIERIGGDLGAVLAIDDLEDAGWTVEGPEEEADGFTRVRFRKPFDDPDEAATIFEEIAGEDGPFQDFAVSQDSSFARTEWGFTRARRLQRRPRGLRRRRAGRRARRRAARVRRVEEIEAQLGEALSRIIQVRVGVRLPGEVDVQRHHRGGNGGCGRSAFGEAPSTWRPPARRRARRASSGVAVAVCVRVLLLAVRARAPGDAVHRQAPDASPVGDDGVR